MRIFIAGGTGFVGEELCRELTAQGHSLRLLVHNKKDKLALEAEQVEGDVLEIESFCDSVIGCDAVINLVGIIREFPIRGITFEKLHVKATRTMIAAAEKAGVKRYLQMSALGTRPNAVSEYHKTKWRAEELVHESGLDSTIFRPSLIYGPKDAFVNMLAGFIRNYPFVPVIGDGKYRIQPISVKDVALSFAMSLNMAETVGKTYELCGPDRFTFMEMIDLIGKVMGKNNVTKLNNPLWLLLLLTPILQNIPIYPITMDQIQMLTEENISDSNWKETFLFDPQRFEAGIGAYLKVK